MSAFVVSHAHINTMLSFANMNGRTYGTLSVKGQRFNLNSDGDLQKMAEILYAQNVRSVHARYPDDDDVSTLPGVIGEVGTDIRYRFVPKRTPAVQQLKLLSCYDYQSCETDDYAESMAAAIVESLRTQAIHALPGYEDAEWEV